MDNATTYTITFTNDELTDLIITLMNARDNENKKPYDLSNKKIGVLLKKATDACKKQD